MILFDGIANPAAEYMGGPVYFHTLSQALWALQVRRLRTRSRQR